MRIPEGPKVPISDLIQKFEDKTKSKAAETAKKSAAKGPQPTNTTPESTQLRKKKIQKIEKGDSEGDPGVHKQRSVRSAVRLLSDEIESCPDKNAVLRGDSDGIRALRLFVGDEMKTVFAKMKKTTNSAELIASLLHNLEMNKGKIEGSMQIFKTIYQSLLKRGFEGKKAREIALQTFFLRGVNPYLMKEGEKVGKMAEAGGLSAEMMKKGRSSEDPTIAAITKILLGERH